MRYNLCSMSPRKDGNGRPLEILLAYVLDDVGAQDIQRALGVSAATYYRRKQQEDYPSADELLLVAHYFGMNPVSLLLSFGLIDKEDTPAAGPVVPPFSGGYEAKGEGEAPEADAAPARLLKLLGSD